MLDGEGDVRAGLIGSALGILFPAAVVDLIFADAVDDVAFCETFVTERLKVEGINGHFGQELRDQLVQSVGELAGGEAVTFDGQGGDGIAKIGQSSDLHQN